MVKKVLVATIVALVALIAVLLFYFVGLNSIPFLEEERQEFFVSNVIDGDTLELSNGYKVRLAGINAPETNFPYAEESTEKLKELVEGEEIFLEYNEFDQYGRIIGYVFLEEDATKTVNEILLEEGLAHFYNPSNAFLGAFEIAEDVGKQEAKGIWELSEENYVEENCLSITEFNFNAEGNDSETENLNNEFVIFKNSCDYEIDLSEWTVKDEATHSFTFPPFILESTWQVTLHSGFGEDSVHDLFWNSSNAIWNNSGDTLFLRNWQGELVLYKSYPE